MGNMSKINELNKKKIGIIIAIIVLVIVVAVCIYFIFFNKKVTDIKCDGDIIEFNVDRQFYLYDDYPLDEETEVEPLREIEVTLKGTGNCATGEFDGVVNIEGFEMGGNLQSYCIQKLEDIYMIDCLTSNVDYLEPVEGNQRYYNIQISDELKEIYIIITELSEQEPVEYTYYYVLNNGY